VPRNKYPNYGRITKFLCGGFYTHLGFFFSVNLHTKWIGEFWSVFGDILNFMGFNIP
jgi:hypothetical protein